ncbi:MAG: preprotein translocase subunit SecE [Burkholderiaceae bacterium]|nr:preprotein translocase subunit SecE [Burkholderiaceae bacterium]
MSNQSVQTVSTSSDKLKIALAIVAVVAGVVGFYFLSDKSTMARVGALVAGLVVAVALVWSSSTGRGFIEFSKESARETRKVVWPERKTAIRITGVVFAFVLVMAAFLWGADKVLEFLLYNVILGWKK